MPASSVVLRVCSHLAIVAATVVCIATAAATIAAGSQERALRLFPEDSRATYTGVFSALASHVREVLVDFSETEQAQLGADSGTYALMTLSGGQPRVYFVQFILDGDGIWRIDSL